MVKNINTSRAEEFSPVEFCLFMILTQSLPRLVCICSLLFANSVKTRLSDQGLIKEEVRNGNIAKHLEIGARMEYWVDDVSPSRQLPKSCSVLNEDILRLLQTADVSPQRGMGPVVFDEFVEH